MVSLRKINKFSESLQIFEFILTSVYSVILFAPKIQVGGSRYLKSTCNSGSRYNMFSKEFFLSGDISEPLDNKLILFY